MNLHVAEIPKQQIPDISKGTTEEDERMKDVALEESKPEEAIVKVEVKYEDKQPRHDMMDTVIAVESSKSPDEICQLRSERSSYVDEDDSDYFPYYDEEDGEDETEAEEEIKELKFDRRVCTACYGIYINFLEGGSTKNRNYVSQNINEIFADEVCVVTYTHACNATQNDSDTLLWLDRFGKQNLVMAFLRKLL